MALRAAGRVAASADINTGLPGGGLTQAPPVVSNAPGGGLLNLLGGWDTETWTWVLFGASVAYLLGAYIVLGRYRIPL